MFAFNQSIWLQYAMEYIQMFIHSNLLFNLVRFGNWNFQKITIKQKKNQQNWTSRLGQRKGTTTTKKTMKLKTRCIVMNETVIICRNRKLPILGYGDQQVRTIFFSLDYYHCLDKHKIFNMLIFSHSKI